MKPRPIIPKAKIVANTTELESFQNQSLRPIIKSLNDLLYAYFQNYAKLKKTILDNLSEEEKHTFISTAFFKDHQFKNELKGIVVGHFSIEEYVFYKNSTKEINKRILGILKQRILSFFDI